MARISAKRLIPTTRVVEVSRLSTVHAQKTKPKVLIPINTGAKVLKRGRPLKAMKAPSTIIAVACTQGSLSKNLTIQGAV